MVDAVLLKDTFAVLSLTAVSKFVILGIATVPVKVGFSIGAFVAIAVALVVTLVFVVANAEVSALLPIAVTFVAISVSFVVAFVFKVTILTPLISAPNPSSPPKTVSPVLSVSYTHLTLPTSDLV